MAKKDKRILNLISVYRCEHCGEIIEYEDDDCECTRETQSD